MTKKKSWQEKAQAVSKASAEKHLQKSQVELTERLAAQFNDIVERTIKIHDQLDALWVELGKIAENFKIDENVVKTIEGKKSESPLDDIQGKKSANPIADIPGKKADNPLKDIPGKKFDQEEKKS